MKLVLAAAAACLLGGCAAQRQAQFNDAAAQCRAQIPAKVGNFVRRAQCINDAANRAGFNDPDNDLLKSTSVELAEKIDKGEMTPAEATAQYERVRYQVAQSEAAQRAASAQAAAAILSSTPQPHPYYQQPYAMPVYQPQRLQTTCTQVGNMLNCN